MRACVRAACVRAACVRACVLAYVCVSKSISFSVRTPISGETAQMRMVV